MESDDDEKRRVMTPPESWGGGPQNKPSEDDGLLGDDSWLSDDADIPADGTADEAGSASDEPAASPEDAAPGEPGAISSDEDDWLGAAPDITAAPDPTTATEAESAAPDPEPTANATPEAEPGPAPVAAGGDDTKRDPEASPTASISAAAAQLMDEELTKEASADNSAEALLTDHKAASAAGPERKVPTWAFAALGLALLLIISGGWGFFSERSKLEAQIDSLEKELQALERSKEGDLSREEEELLIADNQSLRLQIATQREQYAAMASELDQLQAMIDEAQNLTTSKAAAAETADPEPAPTTDRDRIAMQETEAPAGTRETEAKTSAETSTKTQAVADIPATGGDWFVNVASYSRRDIAQEWADKLAADIDNVALQEVTVNGKPLYRVRAVGYPDKASAQQVAKSIEQRYGVGPLWVGRESAGSAEATQAANDPASAEAPATNREVGTEIAAARPGNSRSAGGWFIVVDTFSQGVDADAQARKIRDAGYDAKVAVESRAGELFYRVQVVGINSETQGEETVRALAQLGDLPNLQLRRY